MPPPELNIFLLILIIIGAAFLILLAVLGLMAMFRFIRGEINSNSSVKLDAKNSLEILIEKTVELKKQNEKLKEENGKFKEKITKMEAYMKELKSSIRRRGMPPELMNELFGSMPLENAFVLLAKMSNGILARNVQKMIKSIKMAMKENKWNEGDCGPKLAISYAGLVIDHIGPNEEENCARAYFPIPSFNFGFTKPKFASYFEIEIVNELWNWILLQKIPSLEGELLGEVNNSIGIGTTKGIWIDDFCTLFEKNTDGIFEEGDVIGLGLIRQSASLMECFATLNLIKFGRKLAVFFGFNSPKNFTSTAKSIQKILFLLQWRIKFI